MFADISENEFYVRVLQSWQFVTLVALFLVCSASRAMYKARQERLTAVQLRMQDVAKKEAELSHDRQMMELGVKPPDVPMAQAVNEDRWENLKEVIIECPTCKGDGFDPNYDGGSERCDHCEGVGKIKGWIEKRL